MTSIPVNATHAAHVIPTTSSAKPASVGEPTAACLAPVSGGVVVTGDPAPTVAAVPQEPQVEGRRDTSLLQHPRIPHLYLTRNCPQALLDRTPDLVDERVWFSRRCIGLTGDRMLERLSQSIEEREATDAKTSTAAAGLPTDSKHDSKTAVRRSGIYRHLPPTGAWPLDINPLTGTHWPAALHSIELSSTHIWDADGYLCIESGTLVPEKNWVAASRVAAQGCNRSERPIKLTATHATHRIVSIQFRVRQPMKKIGTYHISCEVGPNAALCWSPDTAETYSRWVDRSTEDCEWQLLEAPSGRALKSVHIEPANGLDVIAISDLSVVVEDIPGANNQWSARRYQRRVFPGDVAQTRLCSTLHAIDDLLDGVFPPGKPVDPHATDILCWREQKWSGLALSTDAHFGLVIAPGDDVAESRSHLIQWATQTFSGSAVCPKVWCVDWIRTNRLASCMAVLEYEWKVMHSW